MFPTFPVDRKSIVLAESLSVHTRNIKVGDVVNAQHVLFPTKRMVKRVLGLEGDMVVVPPSRAFDPGRVVIVPKGHVWIQGDNLERSSDSRAFGPVPYAMVEAKLVFQCWPPSRAGWVRHGPPP